MHEHKKLPADPINPILYGLLARKFGSVLFANRGIPAEVEEFIDPISNHRVERAVTWGEYYCVCCPFCNDSGHKLWVNHLYGSEYDEQRGCRRFTHLAHCNKNGCLKNAPGRYEQFEDLVFGAGPPLHKTMPLRHAEPAARDVRGEPPGDIVLLDELPDEHQARDYLQRRNYDPDALARDFGVGVCVAPVPRFKLMAGRVYIPVVFNGALVGWQGRATNSQRTPKYYNMPGMQKSRILYNYDRARQEPFVVAVEGVPSVWRIGAPGVAVFGKTLSLWQLNTIATTWTGKPIFLALDADAVEELETAAAQLYRHTSLVVPVVFPDDRDPADYSIPELRELLTEAAAIAEVPVDLSRLGGS